MAIAIFVIVFSFIILVWITRGIDSLPRQVKEPELRFEKHADMFPQHWWQAPVNAVVTDLDSEEVERSVRAIKTALAKYPGDMPLYLESIYVFKSMQFYGVPYGGTYRAPAHATVYLANDGYPKTQLERVFHAELSSVLLKSAPHWFSEEDWRACLPASFDYAGDRETIALLELGEPLEQVEASFYEKGFLSYYATTTLENDFNSVVKELFVPSPGFWERLERQPRIAKKVELVVTFYRRFDERFSLEYFKGFDKRDEGQVQYSQKLVD